jgi:hypothetical protein
VRTIANKELRLPNGAHGAPYIAFTTPSGVRRHSGFHIQGNFCYVASPCFLIHRQKARGLRIPYREL